MSNSLSRALLRSSSLIIILASPTFCPSAFASEPLQVVVTADRSEVPLKNTGSAITVITSDEIEKYGSKNIADVLRTVPGLTIAESGGIGGESKVSLRGATSGASMVLLDGVRISDPSNTEGYFDFGNFSTANIERIEVLRGPQSALYGSDAMGGVINIITKKGKRSPTREVTVEGGSYGTIGARGSMSGATDKVSYSFGVNALHSEGFPRYGYRVKGPLYVYDVNGDPTSFPSLPKNDPVNKIGVSGNVDYRINEDVSIETGLSFFSNALSVDNPYATIASNVFSSYNYSTAQIANGFIRGKFNLFDNMLKNSVSVYRSSTDRKSWIAEGCYDSSFNPLNCRFGYIGARTGLEYQGDVTWADANTLTFGMRHEIEHVETSQIPDDNFTPVNAEQTTNSVYAQQRFALTNNLDISIAGRVDAIQSGQTFSTWRSAAAYRVDATRTKFRFSIGTGAKAPTPFQKFSTTDGNPNLEAEESFGFDFGIDQQLFDDRLVLSGTYFDSEYKNKISYGRSSACTPEQNLSWGCYYNIGRSYAKGVEIGLSSDLIPDALRGKIAYTYFDTKATESKLAYLGLGLPLYHVPRNQVTASLVYSGINKIEIEPRVSVVGARLDQAFDPKARNVWLPGYFRFDLENRYKVNNQNDAYIRFENLTDAHTEDVYNYGSAGRSVYVGWTSRW